MPSTPSRLAIRPISFANVIFSAWNTLPAYLTISATASCVRNNRRGKRPHTARRGRSPLRASSSPMISEGRAR